MLYKKTNLIILIILIILKISSLTDHDIKENRSLSIITNTTSYPERQYCEKMQGDLLIQNNTQLLPVFVKINLHNMTMLSKKYPKKRKNHKIE